MHDVVPRNGREYEVAIFNPGSNSNQESILRLINPGTEDAKVTITGTDDRWSLTGIAGNPHCARRRIEYDSGQGSWSLETQGSAGRSETA